MIAPTSFSNKNAKKQQKEHKSKLTNNKQDANVVSRFENA